MHKLLNKLEKYLTVDVRHLRKCPNCGSKNYIRSTENETVTKVQDGVIDKHTTFSDTGSTWKCSKCNIYILQDGSWSFPL